MKKVKKKVIVISITFIMFVSIFISLKIIQGTYASYEIKGETNLKINYAMYIFEEGKLDFNLDLGKLTPSEQSYEYTFSISNFNEDKKSDVNIEYNMSLTTTTNLPLEYKLYCNDEEIPFLITYKQDTDGAWYRIINIDKTWSFNYKNSETNIYKLSVTFPISYSKTNGYDGQIDSIKLIINSKQILE